MACRTGGFCPAMVAKVWKEGMQGMRGIRLRGKTQLFYCAGNSRTYLVALLGCQLYIPSFHPPAFHLGYACISQPLVSTGSKTGIKWHVSKNLISLRPWTLQGLSRFHSFILCLLDLFGCQRKKSYGYRGWWCPLPSSAAQTMQKYHICWNEVEKKRWESAIEKHRQGISAWMYRGSDTFESLFCMRNALGK